jgi:hypothetical protein
VIFPEATPDWKVGAAVPFEVSTCPAVPGPVKDVLPTADWYGTWPTVPPGSELDTPSFAIDLDILLNPYKKLY